MTTLFELLNQNANQNEAAVRAAATIGADAAKYIANQIEVAMDGSGPLFKGTFEPYKTRFKFYAEIGEELEQRIASRIESCKFESQVNIDLSNDDLFSAIASPLINSRLDVDKNPLVEKPEILKAHYETALHQALHLTELTSAFFHINHLAEISPFVHIVGPIVGLVISVFGEHHKRPNQDAFAEMARLCNHMEEIDSHLKVLAVGVYRMPRIWERGSKAAMPRQVNEALKEVEQALAASVAKAQSA